MFIDEVIVKCRAGHGGDGAVSWRREKYIPNGGPYGGDGGRGGNILLRATTNQNTLIDFRHKKVLKAEDGLRGATKEMTGRGGEDHVVLLPVGTIVTEVETGKLIVDLVRDGQEFLLCKGGKGGFGNAHFSSSTRQAPNFAELGDEGEEVHVQFELKLVADIGLIGMPNAGKSSLISSITNVRPKIANYPFTTIIPNLGVMEFKGRGLLIEDVPGLIEGASEGKGLGIQFLKHIERTALLCHLLDLGNTDEEIVDNYQIIRNELLRFSPALAEKPEIIILSKIDLVPPDEQKARITKLKKKFKGADVFAISAPMMEGVEALQNFLIEKIPAGQREMQIQEEALKALEEEQPEVKVYDLKSHRNARTISIRRKDMDTFEVFGERIEEIARMTNMQNKESIARMIDVLDREKVLTKVMAMLNVDEKALKDSYFEGSEDIASDPKIVIADRVFRLGDLQFR
jgi:GTP-binding protein